VTVPALGAPIEPDTAAVEVAPARPASPTEAIVVSFEDEACIAASHVESPMVSDLLRTIVDTPEVALSSGTGRAEEASSSVPPGRIVSGNLLGDVMIIEPLIIGDSGDLVRP
jgi:hypothetical protein